MSPELRALPTVTLEDAPISIKLVYVDCPSIQATLTEERSSIEWVLAPPLTPLNTSTSVDDGVCPRLQFAELLQKPPAEPIHMLFAGTIRCERDSKFGRA